MPQTKFQDLTFTVIMVLIFVYVMTFYNAGLEGEVTLSTFGYALTHMWPEVIGAFIAQRYIASPVVKRLVARIFTPGEDKPIFIILATAGFAELPVCTLRPGLLCRAAGTPDLPHLVQKAAGRP